MNYVAKWYDGILNRSSLSLPQSVRVEGVRQQHLGPRLEYAKVEVLVEPAVSFEVRFASDVLQIDANRIFLEAAVFGLLDILLVSEAYPLRNVSVTVTRCDVDPVDSSEMAFRHAGRDAGRKVISALSARRVP